jgi:hypothetical protein
MTMHDAEYKDASRVTEPVRADPLRASDLTDGLDPHEGLATTSPISNASLSGVCGRVASKFQADSGVAPPPEGGYC